ncbi:MAG: hypothetical protein KGL74_04540 [Elusimicrobia bacterium]|nr:hypothetical protein [Elusimicrobiota bacterium]
MALVLLVGGRARAETSVGLDARGVDPMAAVNNREGLDVRDELGRPVSARVVLDQLKRAQAALTAETAYQSDLPKAKTVLPSLDYSAGGLLSLIRLIESVPGPSEWASMPSPRPKLSVVLFAVLGAVLVQAAAASRPRASLPALSSCRRCLEVLRC